MTDLMRLLVKRAGPFFMAAESRVTLTYDGAGGLPGFLRVNGISTDWRICDTDEALDVVSFDQGDSAGGTVLWSHGHRPGSEDLVVTRLLEWLAQPNNASA